MAVGLISGMNSPVSRVEISDFLGLNLVLDSLSAVNLFVGRNGSGKSRVLKALANGLNAFWRRPSGQT
jgi:predicted ATPase